MNLPDFKRDQALNAVRKSMNAPFIEVFTYVDWKARVSTEEEIELEKIEGDGLIVQDWKPIAAPEADGILRGKDGKKLIVYIPEFGKKFHFTDCAALKRMDSEERSDRYVIARGNSTKFRINIGLPWETYEQLDPCLYCMKATKYGLGLLQKYRNKDLAVRSFDMMEWFAIENDNTLFRKPRYDEFTTPKHVYSEDFDKISREFREKSMWRCKICRIDLGEVQNRKFLHVHHRNGVKGDNRDENLLALCVRCHATRPSHAHMKSLPDYNEFINKFKNNKI